MEFCEKLQELRKSRGLTQEELAEKLYVSRTAISKWESGRGFPSIDSVRAISKFFSCQLTSCFRTMPYSPWQRPTARKKSGARARLFSDCLTAARRFCCFCPFVSALLGACTAVFFMLCRQPYAAVFVFVLLIIKTALLLKRR